MEEVEHRKRRQKLVQDIFEEIDQDQSGLISWSEFIPLCEDVRIQTYFKELGIELHEDSMEGFFNLLDFNNNGEIHYEEFMLGVQQLHGTARSIEVARLKHDVKHILRHLLR